MIALSALSLPVAGFAAAPGSAAQSLSPAQQRQVERLKQADQRVHEHEAAHVRAGGSLVTSGPRYTYAYGPDGRQYAVAGEVGIDTSREAKPADNIDKGRRIEAAALAPADPSAQDYRVAAVGNQLAAQGRADLAAANRQEAADAQAARAAGQGREGLAARRLAAAYGPPSPPTGSGFSILAF